MSVKTLSLNIEKSFDDFTLRVNQELSLSGITAIFGASGAGKSTLLRIIAGLERPDKGDVHFGEEVWNSASNFTPAHKRAAGYMFQSGELFPYLSVAGNLDFAEKRAAKQGVGKGISREDLIKTFGLSSLLGRNVTELSGGEKQRVALARTLLSRPKILLLDEPFAGLDHARIREILPYLEALPVRYNIPILYVSHDISTVARLADNILVLDGGDVTAFGATGDIINSLENNAKDTKAPSRAFLSGQIANIDPEFHLTHIAIGNDRLTFPELTTRKIGTDIRVQTLARDVSIALKSPKTISVRNILPAQITALNTQENTAYISVTLELADGQTLYAQITRASAADLNLTQNQNVFAMIKALSFGEQWL